MSDNEVFSGEQQDLYDSLMDIITVDSVAHGYATYLVGMAALKGYVFTNLTDEEAYEVVHDFVIEMFEAKYLEAIEDTIDD